MTKYFLMVSTIFLLAACGTNTQKPEEVKSETEIVPEKVDGPLTVTDTLTEEKMLEAEKIIEEKVPETPKKEEKKTTIKPAAKATLHGSWVLEKVYGAKEPFKMLFPNKAPNITFDLKTNMLNGNNGCNSYNGPFTLKNGVLSISDMIATKMFCEGVKESLYMTTLKMANAYRFEDGKLVLMLDSDDLMRFTAQK